MKRERPDKCDGEERDEKIPARPEGNRHVVLITDWRDRSSLHGHLAAQRAQGSQFTRNMVSLYISAYFGALGRQSST